MTKRKKKTFEELRVQPVDMRRQRRIRFYTVLALVLLPALAFLAGGWASQGVQRHVWDRNARLQGEVERLDAALRAAREELVLHRTDSQVAVQAQERVRAEIKDLRDQIAELEEAVAFYKGIMAPGSGQAGLRVERLDLSATSEPGVYGYRVVLTQVGDNRHYQSGSMTMSLSGRRDGEPVSLNGSEVLADGAETRFRFRYFQELTGRLALPEGVEPDQIVIEAVPTGRNAGKVERNFIWQVQEKNNAWAGPETQ